MHKSEFSNAIDYVCWRGDLPFSVFPLNEVDALIFSQLAYLNFDGLLTENHIPLKQAAKIFRESPDYEQRSYIGTLINANIPTLLEKCALSKRFCDVELSYYVSILDGQKEEQFAAITFTFEKDKSIVAFRGTDDTFIGWKEDFNISFLPVIPYQTDALTYFNKVAENFSGDLYLCGHSKGGNATVYTAVNTQKKYQDRIKGIYNLDGPGFPEDFYKNKQYKAIEKCLHTFFPENSIVGMVFTHSKEYKIVQSNQIGVMQHDPLTWNVMGTEVVQASDFTDESKFFYKSFNEWADRLSAAKRERFVNILFDIIYASGAKTNTEIELTKISSSAKMLVEFKKLEPEDRKYVLEIIHGLVKAGKNNLPMIVALNFDSPVAPVIDRIKTDIVTHKEKIEKIHNNELTQK